MPQNENVCMRCDSTRTKWYEKLSCWLCRSHMVEYEEADFWIDKWVRNNPKR
jgi:hypothetical protein